MAKNEECSVEAKDCHEDSCSVASVAKNEKSLSSAIVNQPCGQVEQGYSATLLAENSVSGVEVKANHEGESSAVSVPNAKKWSHEAIVARSNMRPGRMQKLKLAANSVQNPGFEYLLSWWNDDPAVQIVIKNCW
ncbi:hypothetical protein [Nostoc flagelliforme]|uniref:hypothetical protein n=1 Tax=Nostoc flagelliforme TaxID=1306274 RepID=UPI001F5559B5|nr:hypothetical protein [Nostoc flagelliforme]